MKFNNKSCVRSKYSGADSPIEPLSPLYTHIGVPVDYLAPTCATSTWGKVRKNAKYVSEESLIPDFEVNVFGNIRNISDFRIYFPNIYKKLFFCRNNARSPSQEEASDSSNSGYIRFSSHLRSILHFLHFLYFYIKFPAFPVFLSCISCISSILHFLFQLWWGLQEADGESKNDPSAANNWTCSGEILNWDLLGHTFLSDFKHSAFEGSSLLQSIHFVILSCKL